MSCLINGELKMPPRLKNSHGGTENMARLFLKYVPADSYRSFQVHVSKLTQEVDPTKKQILWAMDNHCDQDTPIGKLVFDWYVFISDWQRKQYLREHNLPIEKTSVIENIIDFVPDLSIQKPTDKVHFVYASVPDRGLDVLYESFNILSQKFQNLLHLTVFSSYKLYAWDEVDRHHASLFEKIKAHKDITYHGFAPDYNEVIQAKYKAHFFLYPCTWLENSCISLIESLACGCICVHTDFSAMPETAAGRSIVYEMPYSREEHIMKCCYIMDDLIIKLLNNQKIMPDYERLLYRHTPAHFVEKWLDLFKKLS
jgi:glycosyltransferase involved in cell wall biosynthesis